MGTHSWGRATRAAGVVALLTIAACSNDSATPNASTADTTAGAVDDTTTTVEAPDTTIEPTTDDTANAPVDGPSTATCDGQSSRQCLLPWPNVAFTVADDSTPTGRRVSLPTESMPANIDGTPIDVSDQNRSDGFSPGSAILLDVPTVDVEASGLAPSTDIGSSLSPDAPIVIVDTVTGDRVPYWAELDAQASSDADRLLLVRPARAYVEGHDHLVVVRGLVDSDGAPIEIPSDWTGSGDMLRLDSALAEYGLADDVQMAWEFPVASTESLSGRALRARELADDALAGASPEFTVTSAEASGDVTVVQGTYEVPSVLSGDGSPGSRLLLDDDGLPTLNTDDPTYTAEFVCAISTTDQLPTVVYGHGLMGSRQEALGLSAVTGLGFANICGTDWIGMSSNDIGIVGTALGDLGNFPQVADRMVQGLVNFHMLGRLVNAEDGFASAEEFTLASGEPALRPDGAVFVGNSQGGILGGAASAITNEWSRVVLGVPGMDYSLLLTRSSDWPQFQTIFDAGYTDEVDRVVALQVIQMLWDRGENDGYVQHLVDDTFEGIEPKSVLMIEAFGDHQVSNVSTEMLARTIGAVAPKPSIGDGRSLDVEHHWGIDEAPASVTDGAVLSLWDFGTPPPPTVNLPPTEPEYGEDPHGAGSDEILVIQQAFTWLIAGSYQPCDGPCVSTVLTGG